MRHRLDEVLGEFRNASDAAVVFIEEDGRGFTAGAFDELVAGTAAWLEGQGIRQGDRVAVWLVNRIEWLALLFALARIGATLVAVNTRYRSAELRHILASSGARLLIMQPGFGRIDFAAVVEGLDPAELPDLESVAVLGSADGKRILDRPTVAFDPRATLLPAGPTAGPASDPDAPLILFTTSGTTKSPKLVVHTQHTIALHALRSARTYRFDAPSASFLSAMPFCGVFGLNTLLAAVAGGATIHLVSMFDVADAAHRIEAHGITHLFGSDEMFRRLIENGMAALASARLCGYASFTPGLGEILKAASEKGLPLCGLYGSSEVHAIFSIQPLDLPIEERLKGGGRPASGAEAEVRVRDKETGRLLPPFEVGELEIRAPTNFVGYFRNEEATREALDPEGFFRTGDIGHLRDDGTFVYAARSGDAIRLAGFLVDPAEIEEVLKAIDGVRDAQVVGVVLDGKPRAAAFVIPTAPDGSLDEARVIAEAANRLAAFKVPVRVFPIDAYPATESSNGLKIQKAKLRQMADEQLALARGA